jgi:hypothetical protein
MLSAILPEVLFERSSAMKEIVIDLIDIIERYFGGCVTDCGGDLDNDECRDQCKHYWKCKRSYDLSDALAKLKNRVLDIKELAGQPQATATQDLPLDCIGIKSDSERGKLSHDIRRK